MVAHATRRDALLAASAAFSSTLSAPAASAILPPSQLALASRLDAASLTLPGADGLPSFDGPLRYPNFLLGTWELTNRVQRFSMPLGANFVDDFTRYSLEDDIRRAEELRYLMRWRPGPADAEGLDAVLDRGFSGQQEASAFLGEAVLDSKYSLPREAPHGRLELKFAGEGGGPPILSAIDTVWCRWAYDASRQRHATTELLRQRVRAGGDAVEETLVESSTVFVARDKGIVARNRQASYATPASAAYVGLAAERATAITDYTWSLRRVDDWRGEMAEGRAV